VITSDHLDPFFVVFSDVGCIHVYDTIAAQWTLEAELPISAGVINSVQVRGDGDKVILNATRGTFYYDKGWVMLSEPTEPLVVKLDQTVFAQAAALETAIAAAIQLIDFDEFEQATLKYLVFLATYAPIDAFLSNWYSLIVGKNPFELPIVRDMWHRILEILSALDRVAPYVEELKMSMDQI
jgi:hypothetical protein